MNKAFAAQLAAQMGGMPLGGAHIENKDDEEEPPPEPYVIHTAGNAKDVADYIAKNGNINAVNEDGATPVWSAAVRKSNVCDALVKAGADFLTPNNAGVTPLQAAAWAGAAANSKLLVLAKAHVDEQTFVPLKVATALDYSVVEALVEAGVPCATVLKGVPVFHGWMSKDVANGVEIVNALPGQSAKRAGLKAGDVVTHFDGKPLKNEAMVNDILRNHQLSDRIAMQFVRGGEVHEKDLILGAVGYSWYNVDGVGLLREKERILAIEAEEAKHEMERQMKLARFEPVLAPMMALFDKNVKKGKMDAKGAAAALKKKCKNGLAKATLKGVGENWEDEEHEGQVDLREFAIFVCEQLDEEGVDVHSLIRELNA